MNFNLILIILTFLIVSCVNDNEKNIIDEYVNTEGQDVIEYQLNDSIIERILKKNDKIEARELENTSIDSVLIFYYDKYEKLSETVKLSTEDPNSLYENCTYHSNGKVAQKIIRNQEYEKLSVFFYSFDGKLTQEQYYREGQTNINSWLSYNSHGEIDKGANKTEYLQIDRKDDSIYITPIGNEGHIFKRINFTILKEFSNPKSRSTFIMMAVSLSDVTKIGLSISDISQHGNRLHCVISCCDIMRNGLLSCNKHELYIESLLDIPENNLFPIKRNM